MEPLQQLQQLVASFSETDLRELCLAALRHVERERKDESFSFADLGRKLVPELMRLRGVAEEQRRLEEHFQGALRFGFMGPVLDFLWWLVRAELAVPLGTGNRDHIVYFQFTRAGIRFLKSTSPDHPLLPGFLDRMRSRCAGIDDEPVALLVDAHACFGQGLNRAAIALMGIAFEHVVEQIAEALAAPPHNLLPTIPTKAAARITAIRGVLGQRFPGNTVTAIEQRSAADDACVFASELRRRRNDASHTSPRYGFNDREEVEEFLVSVGRRLPALWAIR